MPNTESCRKRLRQDAIRRAKNHRVKHTIKSMTKKIRSNMDVSEKESMMSDLYAKIDKAAKVGIIHKRTASRKKSRLMAVVNKEKALHQQQ